MTEIWKTIPGVSDVYEVSNLGQVRSNRTGRSLAPWAHPRAGHLQVRVTLKNTGKRSTRYIHHLVLLAFSGERPDGYIARHLNDIPSDNRAENLAWGTASENTRDSVRNGSNRNTRKTHCPRGHALEAPNLVRSKPKGHRECLACSRARASAKTAPATPLNQLADSAYSRIVTAGRRIFPEVSDA